MNYFSVIDQNNQINSIESTLIQRIDVETTLNLRFFNIVCLLERFFTCRPDCPGAYADLSLRLASYLKVRLLMFLHHITSSCLSCELKDWRSPVFLLSRLSTFILLSVFKQSFRTPSNLTKPFFRFEYTSQLPYFGG